MRLFISYAHVDKYLVEKEIVSVLIDAGHDVWIDDRLQIGGQWAEQLFNEIESADAFIFAMTPESVASEWCQKEVNHALKLKKPIFPILLQERTAIPGSLSHYQYVDFSKGATANSVARLTNGLQQVQETDSTVKPTHIPHVKKEEKSKVSLFRLMGGALGLAVAFATLFSVLPESTREEIFYQLGLLAPPATATLTSTATPAFTSTPAPTATDAATPATPQANALRDTDIRLGPGSEYSIVSTLAQDDRRDITGVSEDEVWYQILRLDGSSGWILASQNVVAFLGDRDLLQVVTAPTLTPTETLTQTPTATLTEPPTLTATITLTRPPTQTPQATNTPALTNTASVGYPCDAEIVFTTGAAMNQVHVSPLSSSPRRAAVQQGSAVTILQQQAANGGIWYQIRYDNDSEQGWILAEYVILSGNCPR